MPAIVDRRLVLAVIAGSAMFVSACTAGTTSVTGDATSTPSTSAATTSTTSDGGLTGAPDAPPGGTTTSQEVTGTGAYTIDGQTATETDANLAASDTDESAVLASNDASLTLVNPTITTSGNSSSSDASSFYGLNAGVLATSGASVTIDGGSVTTTGDGANGVFAYGDGSSITMSDATIDATGQYAHGAMTSGGGSVTLDNVTISTAGANSAALATDRGGGTIVATGGTTTTSGQDSPALYSTGTISVTGGTYEATGSEAAVIEGSNSISATDATLSSSIDDKWGVLIYQSMSGDASGSEGSFTMTGGSLAYTGANGPLFYVTNSTGTITLSGVDVEVSSGILVRAAAGSWGTSGSNGGTAILEADGQTLVGDLESDDISSITVNLANGSSLTGAINSAALTLDATSTWTVGGDSTLTTLSDEVGLSGTTLTNIIGNGHTVTYDSTLDANAWLNGGSYQLTGGGTLTPA